jgi:hypothetical protein
MFVSGTFGLFACIMLYKVMKGVLSDVTPLAGNAKVDSLIRLVILIIEVVFVIHQRIDVCCWHSHRQRQDCIYCYHHS